MMMRLMESKHIKYIGGRILVREECLDEYSTECLDNSFNKGEDTWLIERLSELYDWDDGE